MTADKRTVKTDALDTLGSIIGKNEKRDAIHLAVEPVVAAEVLLPGQDVGFVEGGVGRSDKPVGIVDPFIRRSVLKGERFWLVVYPRQITSLRHVWTHPDFPEAPHVASDKAASEAWLRDFVDKSDCPDYETVIARAVNNSDAWDRTYLHFQDENASGEIPPEFWVHVQVVTGRAIPTTERASHFSCSC